MNRPNSLQAGTEAYVSQGFSTSALLASGTGWSPVVRLSCGMFSSTSGVYSLNASNTLLSPAVTPKMCLDISKYPLRAKSSWLRTATLQQTLQRVQEGLRHPQKRGMLIYAVGLEKSRLEI